LAFAISLRCSELPPVAAVAWAGRPEIVSASCPSRLAKLNTPLPFSVRGVERPGLVKLPLIVTWAPPAAVVL